MISPKSCIPLSLLLALGCTPPAETPPQETGQGKPQVVWIDIPDTQDRMLVTMGAGQQREAVTDVPWTQEMRETAVQDGFTRGRDAHMTRAVYGFHCRSLSISTNSYAVLSEQGETLTSQLFAKPNLQPAEPGSTAARYLVAACDDELAPAAIKRLLGIEPPAR